MMTQRLFFTDDNLTTELEVVDCTPHANQFAVILRSTIFHPQGGGQPCDTGWLGDSQVLRVLQEQDLIVHYVNQPLMPGLVQARVDAQHRALHTRLHSAGHLIGNVGETLGWMPIKANHWPGEGRITFIAGQAAQAMESGLIQATATQNRRERRHARSRFRPSPRLPLRWHPCSSPAGIGHRQDRLPLAEERDAVGSLQRGLISFALSHSMAGAGCLSRTIINPATTTAIPTYVVP